MSCELAGVVDIIDVATLTVTDKVAFRPAGFRPEQVTPVDLVMTADGSRAYVALGRANHVAVVDVREPRDRATTCWSAPAPGASG